MKEIYENLRDKRFKLKKTKIKMAVNSVANAQHAKHKMKHGNTMSMDAWLWRCF